jgi:anti-sigma-K factor RskA
MTHDELRELSGGYALGVLDEPERRAFEQHLATCASCAAEIRDFTAVASALALDVPQVEPPRSLRERVLRAATQPGPQPAVIEPIAEHRALQGEPSGRALRQLQRRPRRESLLALLSAAAVVIAVALGAYAISLQRRIAALEEQVRTAADRAAQSQQQLVQLRAAADLSTQVRRILAADDLRRLDLAGTKAAPAASGRAFWSQREGLVVAFANLPATDAGRVYQLWVIPPGGTPIDAGLLELQPDGRALTLARAGTSQRVGTVAITLEPSGGSPVPTLNNMIAAGTLTN